MESQALANDQVQTAPQVAPPNAAPSAVVQRPHDDREWINNVAQLVTEAKSAQRAEAEPGPIAVDPFDQDLPQTQKPGLAGYVEMIQRRIRGDYEVDEFGCDPLYGNMWWPLFTSLYRYYWRVETAGVEHVPAGGRAMLVANHSGGSYAWDSVMISAAIHHEHPRPRMVRYVSTEFFYDYPFLSYDTRKKGSALACREDFVRLLEHDRLVGVFPESTKGFLKPSDRRYRVQRFGRGGFMQLAMMTRTPIIPVAVVGGEDLHFSLGDSRLLARLVNRLLPVERVDTFPVLLNLLPLPVKWRIEFCEPIDLSGYGPEAALDTLVVQQLTQRVRMRIQEGLDRNLRARRWMFW
ncbi:MAG: lysophospholipid acyltransferase family protein [Candidatus Binataceae bacterium]